MLNKLPYWKQIKFKVVDPKNLISGILELHSQTVWGLEKKQWISSRNKKKQIDHLNKNVDQFSEDDYEKWLEKEKNPLENNNRIVLQSLQEAIMEIDEEIKS